MARLVLAGVVTAGSSIVNTAAEACGDYATAPRIAGNLTVPGASLGKVATANEHAFIANAADSTLVVIDVTDPSAPQPVTALPLAAAPKDVVVSGVHAFVAAGSAGLIVVDVANPAAPAVLGSVVVPGGADAVDVEGSLAFVGNGVALRVVDVSVPASPAIVGSVAIETTGVAAMGSIVFAGGVELRVVDVSTPSAPSLIGSTSGEFNPLRIALEGNLLFGASPTHGVVAFDVGTPTLPVFLSSLGGADVAVDVATMGSMVFATTMTDEVLLVEAANPSAMKLLDALAAPPSRAGIAVFENHLLVTGDEAFSTIGVASIPSLVVAHVPATSAAQALATAANRVFMLEDLAFTLFDVTDPAAPSQLGSLPIEEPWLDAAISGNFAFIAASFEGLRVVDCTNPASMTIVESLDTPGSANGIALAGVFAVIADGDSGLQVVDVTNPLEPFFVGSLPTADVAYSVIVQGSMAFVAEGEGGVEVVDLSNPAEPTVIGTADTAGEAVEVALVQNFLYVADGFEGISVFDVSVPATPMFLDSIALGAYTHGVAVHEGGVYAADALGLYAIDGSSPASLEILGTVGALGDEYGVAIENEHVFLAGDSGLSVCVTQCKLVPVLVSDFHAVAGTGEVALSWVASFDGAAGGFNVYRSEVETGGYARLNEEVIPGKPGAFVFVDQTVEPLHTYYYRLASIDGEGTEVLMAELSVETPMWGNLVTELAVAGTNPFSRSAALRLVLVANGAVRAAIHDVSGRRVQVLADRTFAAGVHELAWDGRDEQGRTVAPGVYLASVEAGGTTHSRRLVVLR